MALIRTERSAIFNEVNQLQQSMVNHLLAVETAKGSETGSDLTKEIASNEQTLLTNSYPQDRGLFKRGTVDNLSHLDFFSDRYLTFLQNLSRNDNWLNIGPGDFFAEVDYFASASFQDHATVISNAYVRSQNDIAHTNLRLLEPFAAQGKFICFEGVKFQQLKEVFSAKVKLISDVFAAGSYDEDLFGVFKTASEFLEPGGMLAVVLASVTFESANGSDIDADNVFANLKGFQLIDRTRYDGWLFLRTEEEFSSAPWELRSFTARDETKKIYWPIRRYKVS